MADIITTLHPENDDATNLYPNIKKENIPDGSIDLIKLDNSVISFMGSLKPSGVDTSSNILSKTSDTGIWIGSDTGKWYYWDGTHYIVGGDYIANINAVTNVGNQLKDSNNNNLYPKINFYSIFSGLYPLFKTDKISLTFTDNTFWSVENPIVELKSYTGLYKASNIIEVNEGEIYHIKVTQGFSAKTRGWMITRSDFTFIDSSIWSGSAIREIDEYVLIPQSVTKLLITNYGDNTDNVVVEKLQSVVNDFVVKDSDISYLVGKKISIMGDSFSSYVGTIPSGYTVYYTGSNSGVSNVNEMWWKILSNYFTLDLLVNNSDSGSCVTADIRTDRVEASSVERTGGLDDGVNDPDIILIEMGTNDYSYNAPIGDYDGTTALNNDVTTFRSAYATMISRIQENYPNAIIVCLLPSFNQRGTYINPTYKNNLDLTLNDYRNAVIDICNLFNIPYINSSVGFNKNNYYPKYCIDNASNPTHPNALGQKLIAENVINNINDLIKAYIENK